jgi:flagellar hook protein FlgE
VDLSPLNGMRAATALVDRAAVTIASAPESGADLAAPMVDLVIGPLAYTANARVLDAQDAMMRSLLDLRA